MGSKANNLSYDLKLIVLLSKLMYKSKLNLNFGSFCHYNCLTCTQNSLTLQYVLYSKLSTDFRNTTHKNGEVID